MALPSEDAVGAARSLLRPRGAAAQRLGGSSLRTLALRFRTPKAMARVNAERPRARAADGLSVSVEQTGTDRGCTLALSGELDGRSIVTLENALERCARGGASSITLDLRNLSFIDSAGLWTITTARTWCERRGHDFSLLPAAPPVQRIFEVTGLSDVLPFRAAADQASAGAHTAG